MRKSICADKDATDVANENITERANYRFLIMDELSIKNTPLRNLVE